MSAIPIGGRRLHTQPPAPLQVRDALAVGGVSDRPRASIVCPGRPARLDQAPWASSARGPAWWAVAGDVAGLRVSGSGRGAPLSPRYYDGSIAAQQSVTVKGIVKV